MMVTVMTSSHNFDISRAGDNALRGHSAPTSRIRIDKKLPGNFIGIKQPNVGSSMPEKDKHALSVADYWSHRISDLRAACVRITTNPSRDQ